MSATSTNSFLFLAPTVATSAMPKEGSALSAAAPPPISTSDGKENTTQEDNVSVPGETPPNVNSYLVLTPSVGGVPRDTKAPTTASKDEEASTSGQ